MSSPGSEETLVLGFSRPTLLNFLSKSREHLPGLGYAFIGVACTLFFILSALYAYPDSFANRGLLEPARAECTTSKDPASSPSASPSIRVLENRTTLPPSLAAPAAGTPSPPRTPPAAVRAPAAAPAVEPPPFVLPRALIPGQKYLFYGRTDDWCKGAGHYTWSLQCALAEARFLGRRFALDEQLCVPAHHNRGRSLNADFRFYYDVGYINRAVPLTSMQALQQQHPWDSKNTNITYKKIPAGAPALPYRNDAVTVLHRDMRGKYAYDVCGVPENRKLLRPTEVYLSEPIRPGGHYNPPWKTIVLNIRKVLGPDFVAVHVRRGDKASQRRRWPHLDNDTRPESLLKKLPLLAPNASVLYIATDEWRPGFFDPLKAKYVIFLLSDFQAFWSATSDWARACRRISPRLPQFDGFMQAMVDYNVIAGAKQRIETFNQLTSDGRHG